MISISSPKIGLKERLAVDKVLRSGNLAQGTEVYEFEGEFAEYHENRNCVAVNSGTSALHLSLLASGVTFGDEVIVPSFTFAATANAVMLVGAKPVFVDIDPATFNIDISAIKAALTPRTVAIQPVHLYGLPANMPEILDLAQKNNLLVFEDAAQSHLASINNKNIGTFGDCASFSFYPTKNMTSGEGGMIVANSKEIAKKCRILRNQGMERKYENEVVGFNLRMTDIHAAIGRVQLRRLPSFTKKRIKIAEFYNENLKGVVTPFVPEGYKHVYHQYTVRVVDEDRDKFAKELQRRGIPSGVYYPIPVHHLPSFNLTNELPATNLACSQVLSLPIHPGLSQRQTERVVQIVNQVARAGA
jgi:dTDP-4-amino-4,6-dideoxygalactose transaminase